MTQIDEPKQDTYREHSVGSHSDDRGGDSDLPCYCDRRINQDITSIDEQIERILLNVALNGAYEDAGQRVLSRHIIGLGISDLSKLIATQINQARIDELSRLDRSSSEMTQSLPRKIGERLKELQGE